MDEFYRHIHTLVLKKWLLLQSNDQLKVYSDSSDPDTIIMETHYGKAFISFYDLDIIELKVTSTIKHEDVFYLHFQMNNLHHALSLYNEMCEALLALENEPVKKVLLCCSSGMTTTYFALKLQETARLLDLHYEISALGIGNLYEQADHYDVIMLAPQIAYLLPKVRAILPGKTVFAIPAKVFARYDTKSIFQMIEKKTSKKETVSSEFSLHDLLEFKEKILCLSLFRNENIHIDYRLYGNGKVLVDRQIIKQKISINDLYDVIDTVLAREPDVTRICFSTPGIINHGIASSANINGFAEMDYNCLLKSRYEQPVTILNDVNASAIGYDLVHHQFSSLVFLFQPNQTAAGAGIMINHHLLKGHENAAGEIQFLPCYLIDHQKTRQTPEDFVLLLRRIVLSYIATMAPEAIVISCAMLPYIEDLENALKEVIDAKYIPQLIKEEEIQEYIFVGLLKSGLEENSLLNPSAIPQAAADESASHKGH